MQHGSREYFDSNKGLDLKASELTRNPRFAASMRNAQYRRNGPPEKRRGWQKHAAPADGFGLFNFRYIDANDQPVDMVLSVGKDVNRLLFTQINVAYAGAEASAYLSVFFDPATDTYRCQILAGLNAVLDLALGKGDEVNPVTVAALGAQIAALPGFSANVQGAGATPAAFLRVVRDIEVKSTPWVGVAGYWAPVNQATASPFAGSLAARGAADFENVSGAVVHNCLFLSNGYDPMQKFDGQNLYRAGLPRPGSISSALNGAGAVTGSNYQHRAQFVQVDAAGNYVAGNALPVSALLTAAAQRFSVTVPNVLAGSGYNLNAGIAPAAQLNTNVLTLGNGSGAPHTLLAGDTAYFFDTVSGKHVERAITAATATTITVAGAPVSVAQNAVVSNNLRVLVMRNKDSATTPTVFYEVAQVPNNPWAATQVLEDNLTDTSLGALISLPNTDRSPPPRAKYICSYQGLLFATGNPTDPAKLYWSDIDSPEYFPAAVNEDRVETESGGVPTAISGAGSVLAVFTRSSTIIGSGTFADTNYRLEEVARNIGCEAHSSLAQVEGYLTWWSARGPYAMAAGQLPQPLGATEEGEGRLSPLMNQPSGNPALAPTTYRAKRCVAFNWAAEAKVLFFLPCENEVAGARVANGNSRVFAYDYSRDAWLQWDSLDFAGGIAASGTEVYFKNRRLVGASVQSELARMHNLGDPWDYQDNDQPIAWEYGPQWESLGAPGVLKKFLALQVFNIEEDAGGLNVTVRQEVDFHQGGVVAEFPLRVAGQGYGLSQYGVDGYGDTTLAKLKHELAGRRCLSTRVVFSNSAPQENCPISGWELFFATPYRNEAKR